MNSLLILAIETVDWLGQRSGPWRGSSSQKEQRELAIVLLFSTALILLFWLITRIHGRVAVPRTPNRPWRVFWCLLKHHGLGVLDRLLLCVIVCGRRVRQPAVMLLSPSLFTRIAMQWLDKSGLAPVWPGARQRLTRIAQQVFAEPGGPIDGSPEVAQK